MQALYWGPARREEIAHRDKVEQVIDFLEIQQSARRRSAACPTACRSASNWAGRWRPKPEILLLDEPMAGMNVEEKQDMCRFILDVNDQFGTTIVLIEHDMGVVMDISDRVVVLDYGKQDRRRHAGRGARQPGRDQCLSGRGHDRQLEDDAGTAR